jgi:coenzyme F420-reducing hydrogenase delta subunit
MDGTLSLAMVDPFRCISCGNCLVTCPVKAIDLPGWEDETLLAQIDAALQTSQLDDASPEAKPILAFSCEWSAIAAADLAGIQRLPIPLPVRIIPLNCSTRLDPFHILWALLNGGSGVFVGACRRGECHYGMGNLNAMQRIESLQKQLDQSGIDSNRLQIELFTGDDGSEFADAINAFASSLKTQRVNLSDENELGDEIKVDRSP